MINHSASAYQKVNVQTGAAFADPRTLIVMLFDGALERIAKAKGAILQKNIPLKGKLIGEAVSIIEEGLRGSLNMDSSEVSNNLNDLYIYIGTRLLKANINNDIEILQEVSGLLINIKSAWGAIPEDVKQDYAKKHPPI